MKTFTFFSIIAGITFAMSAAGCSDADSENQLLPDDSRGEQSEISYDNRFPFHVWKDAEGEMRHDNSNEKGLYAVKKIYTVHNCNRVCSACCICIKIK